MRYPLMQEQPQMLAPVYKANKESLFNDDRSVVMHGTLVPPTDHIINDPDSFTNFYVRHCSM